MQVIVSNVAKHHAYQTALALQEADWLKRFYTSFYALDHPPLSQKLLRTMLPQDLREKVMNRKQEGLDEQRIVSFYFPEILERIPIIRRMCGRYRIMNIKNDWFDRRVARQRLECDVFHGFEGCSLYSLRQARKAGAITVLDESTFHPTESRQQLRRGYEDAALPIPKHLLQEDGGTHRKYLEFQEADFIFVASEKIKQDFVRYEQRSPDTLLVVPYGFEPERFKPKLKQEKTFKVLFVGQVGVGKGVLYLLEAFQNLGLSGAELILIGNIQEGFEPILHKYAGLFKHYPSLAHHALVEKFNEASVFVLPSLVESFGIVTCEAMACGIPVIVSENCGMQPRDGKDGFVVPIRDIEALKEKILLLYEREDLRRSMGESAAQYVKQFTWENYRQKVQEAYHRIKAHKLASVRPLTLSSI
ncbi:MAG: glycosyltransferase family 4 protein [Candidatus Thermochlorobacter sp.]